MNKHIKYTFLAFAVICGLFAVNTETLRAWTIDDIARPVSEAGEIVSNSDPTYVGPSKDLVTGEFIWSVGGLNNPLTGESAYAAAAAAGVDVSAYMSGSSGSAAPAASSGVSAANTTGAGNNKGSEKKSEVTVTDIAGTYVTKEDAAMYRDTAQSEEVSTLPLNTYVDITGESSNGLFRFTYEDEEVYANKNAFVDQKTYDEAWEETSRTEPTCTAEGSLTRTNSISGATETSPLKMLEHQYEVSETVEPTCTEDGKKVYTCAICGDSYEEVVDKLGHDTGEWVVAAEPGWFHEGTKELRCTRDGAVLNTGVIAQTCPLPLWGVILIIAGVGAAILVIALLIRRAVKKAKIKNLQSFEV